MSTYTLILKMFKLIISTSVVGTQEGPKAFLLDNV